MTKQARHIYPMVESGDMTISSTLKQEIEEDHKLSMLDDTSGHINPYKEPIVNNTEKIDTVLLQMEQWSILGNVVKYIQYDKHPKNFPNLSISAVHKKNNKGKSNLEEGESHSLDLDFGDTPDKLKEKYLDVYKGIQSEILSTTSLMKTKIQVQLT